MSALPASMSTMRRPHEGRILLGVCAAIARRLDLDPTLVRVVAAIGLFVLTTPVLVAYAGLALVVPRDDGRMLIGGEPRDRRESIIGWATVALAAGLVIATPTIFGFGNGVTGFEVGMLVIAVALIAWATGRSEGREPASPASAPAPAAGAAPGPAPDEPATAPTAALATAVTDVHPGPEQPTATLPPDPATYTPAPREPKGPSLFVPVAAAIVGLIGLTAVVLSVFGVDVTAVAVAVVAGSAAVISAGVAIARFGQRGTVPLLILGALFAIVASVATIGRDEFDRGVGYRDIDPLTVSEVEQGYDHGVGFLEIDLRDVELPPGETTMPVHIGWGAAEIRVPDDLQVVSSGDGIDGPVAANTEPAGSAESTAAGAEGGKAATPPAEPPTLVIDAEVGIGAIELARGDDRAFDRGGGD